MQQICSEINKMIGAGKKEYDKRQTIKERDQKREIHRGYGI